MAATPKTEEAAARAGQSLTNSPDRANEFGGRLPADPFHYTAELARRVERARAYRSN